MHIEVWQLAVCGLCIAALSSVGTAWFFARRHHRDLQALLLRQDAHERAMWASVARTAAESKGRSKEEWEGIFLDVQNRMHRLEREKIGPQLRGVKEF